MKRIVALLFFAVSCAPLSARAGDGPSAWQAVAQAAFDPAKSARVSGLVLERDHIRITLQQGVIQFSQPVEGVVFAAAFRGTGRIRVSAPNPREAQQLKLFIGNEELVDLEFHEMVLSFSDGTFAEVASQVQWEPAAADASLASLYQERQEFREKHGTEILTRLVKGVLSASKKQTEYFFAEMKTGDKGWVFARLDALDPEEIAVGRWAAAGPFQTRDTWMHFPRGKGSSAEAWQNPTAREDVLPESYQIFATVNVGAELSARTIVLFKPQWTGERQVNFLLDSNVRVSSIKDTLTGTSVPFIQSQERKDRTESYGNYVAVFFAEPLTAGKNYSLEFNYAGKRVVRQVGPGSYFAQSLGWYPGVFNFAMRSNFEMTFRSPKQYSLVATGARISDTVEGNEQVTVWKSEKPLAVAGFAYGEVKIEKTSTGTVDVEVFANKQPDDQMREILRRTEGGGTENMGALAGKEKTGVALGTMSPAAMAGQIATETANSIKLFESYFGPYPYKRLAVSTIPYGYGQGWPSLLYLSALTFMDPFQRKQLGIDPRTERRVTDFFRAHETSHQWWGHKVSWKSYHDQWLSEGFAEFSGNLYTEKRSGKEEYLDRIRQARKSFFLKDTNGHTFDSIGPIWMGFRLSSTESPGAYNRLVYEKGGFVLHMLRMLLMDPRAQDPEGRFRAMMHDFTKTYDNGAASTEDFKAVAEKYMIPDMNLDGNGRLDWFFNQYVFGTGIPAYDFKYSLTDAGAGKWKLSGTVTQSGVPAGWKDVLPLYLEVNKNVFRVGTISLVQPVLEFEQVMPFKPDRVILCLNEDSIAVIKQ